MNWRFLNLIGETDRWKTERQSIQILRLGHLAITAKATLTPSNADTLLKTCINIFNSWQRTPLPMIGAERSLPSPTRRRACIEQDKVRMLS